MNMRSAFLLCVLSASSVRAAEVPSTSPDSSAESVRVKVDRVAFQGWTDAWKLSNSACELIVVPQISRVMSFALKGGENLFWVAPAANGQVYSQAGDDWRNLGGDKIWPEPQAVWGWPPPYFFDNAPSDAEAIPNGVRIRTKKLSPRLGSVCVREFVLDPDKARVTVRQRLEKIQGEPISMTLWNITQVRKPEYSLLPLGPEDALKLRYRSFDRGKLEAPQFQIHETVLSLRNDESGPKVGVSPNAEGSNGWVAAVYANCMLIESRRIERNAIYPDNQCHAELFAAPKSADSYVELEMLSPLKAIKPGESLSGDSVWQIVSLTKEQAKDPEQVAAVARTTLEKP